jgi:hypothetical protein
MQHSPTRIVQSFWLRFWHESGQAEPQWRGTIWHEQQDPGEKAKPVAGPEEAFEIVRRALELPPDEAAGGQCAQGAREEGWFGRLRRHARLRR